MVLQSYISFFISIPLKTVYHFFIIYDNCIHLTFY